MAISIELWVDQQLVGGTEQWWDDVELWLASMSDAERNYPLLSQVDPYGFFTVGGEDLPSLRAELERAMGESPPRVSEIAAKLDEVCLAAVEPNAVELRFVGD